MEAQCSVQWCNCKNFSANVWKKNRCANCMHLQDQHSAGERNNNKANNNNNSNNEQKALASVKPATTSPAVVSSDSKPNATPTSAYDVTPSSSYYVVSEGSSNAMYTVPEVNPGMSVIMRARVQMRARVVGGVYFW